MKSYKYAVWQAMLDAGVHILAVDPDVVFLQNPILVLLPSPQILQITNPLFSILIIQ